MLGSFGFLLKFSTLFILQIVQYATHSSLNVLFITTKSGLSKKNWNLQYKFRQCSQDSNLTRSPACGSIHFHMTAWFSCCQELNKPVEDCRILLSKIQVSKESYRLDVAHCWHFRSFWLEWHIAGLRSLFSVIFLSWKPFMLPY